MMDKMQRVSDLTLERLLLKELPETEAKAVMARLGTEPGGLERLEALRSSNQEILTALPPEAMADQIKARHRVVMAEYDMAQRKAKRRTFMTWVPAMAAFVAIILFVLPQNTPVATLTGDTQIEDTRTKGIKPHLALYRKTASGAERLDNGSAAAPGDVLQLGYTSAGMPFGAILSIDGRGVVTLHHPTGRHRQPTLTTTGLVSLPRSYELDDAPDFERFFLLTSQSPFKLGVVMDAAKSLAAQGGAENGSLNLPHGVKENAFIIQKVTP